MDHDGATTPKSSKHEGVRQGAGSWPSFARLVVWLLVVGVTYWLLSMTLRTSDEISLGRIRVSDPVHELNLQLFRNKILAVRRMLESPDPRTQRAARNYLFIDVLGNVAVFIPFGAALGAATLIGRRRHFWLWWLSVTAVGLLLSLFIEIAQLAIPSRVTDIDDIILNTAGTAIGALAVWCVFRLIRRA